MVVASMRYHFRQSFRAPARAAFAWCTQYEPADARLFSSKRTRSVRWLNPDTVILTDVTFPEGRPLRIRRLVRIDPDQLAWTNTHLDGPFRHSQFWYRIVSDGPSKCHLEFDGLKLQAFSRRPSAAKIARLAAQERAADSSDWRTLLGRALEAEVRTSRSR